MPNGYSVAQKAAASPAVAGSLLALASLPEIVITDNPLLPYGTVFTAGRYVLVGTRPLETEDWEAEDG